MKFACRDSAGILRRLLALGFAEKGRTGQRDTYYRCAEPAEDGALEYLRLREDLSGRRASLDLHRAKDDLATEEHETAVSDPKAMKQILAHLGYEVRCIVEKERTALQKGKALVMLDGVKGLGSFIELETEGDDEAAAEKGLSALAGELGLTQEDRVRDAGYPDLLLQKRA